jgi:hypothetical protein
VRVKGRIAGLKEKIGWIARKALAEVFDRPLPLSLRTDYIVSIYRRAIRVYKPQVFRGRVILFKTQGQYRRAQLGWDEYVSERIEIQELDTEHDNVFKEPYVQTFAQKLKTYLSNAQSHATVRGDFR